MNKKSIFLIRFSGFVIPLMLLVGCSPRQLQREPITITAYASEAELSLDDLISMADLIVVGDFEKANPSRWSTTDGKLPDNATIDSISQEHLSIFTDWDFHVVKYIKGVSPAPTISVRTLGGQVGEDTMIVSDAPTYEIGKTYLLFLFLETGPTSDVAPGAYYGTSSPYEIIDNRVISADGEWPLEVLIAYIEKTLSVENTWPTETPVVVDTMTETPELAVEITIPTATP